MARSRAIEVVQAVDLIDRPPKAELHSHIEGTLEPEMMPALDDEALVARLVADQVARTLRPLSNPRLGVIGDMAAHPQKRMMGRGLFVAVNSDDPAYFGGHVNENYRAARDASGADIGGRRPARAEFVRGLIPGQGGQE